VSGSHHAPPPNGYDCRTAPEREAADIAQLRDALDYLTRRVAVLEQQQAAMRTALEHQADTLQVLVLRGAP
jgi:hypothetical protein